MRINWTDPTLSGGLFEKIVGCLLQIERPHSVRVRPSQGDGGIDIFDPTDDGRIDVYQLKYYPNVLQWSKISKSLKRLSEGNELGREVRDWYLVVPKQPTPTDAKNLLDLDSEVSFTARWYAEDALTKLAAAHPEVGEYYLGDGRSRLERLIVDWDACTQRLISGESPHIEDVHQKLTDIADALGRNDPHFEYGVEVQPVRHAGPIAVEKTRAVAMSSTSDGRHVVSCYVYPRFRGAEVEAGDRLNFRLQLTTEAGQRVADLMSFGGQPVELSTTDIVDYTLPKVGHQIPAEANIAMRVVPYVDTTPATIRVIATPPGGSPVVDRFTRRSVTAGDAGATSTWKSSNGWMELFLVARNEALTAVANFKPCIDFGRPIRAGGVDFELLRAFQPGTTVGLALGHGPLEPMAAGIELSEEFVEPELIALLDALRVIQTFTTDIVTIPDQLTTRDAIEVVELAALLAGIETTGNMHGAEVTLTVPKSSVGENGEFDALGEQFTIATTMPIGAEIDLPHQTIHLAEDLLFVRVFRTARVGLLGDSDDDNVSVTLEPGSMPFWIDVRISNPDEFTDELHQSLCRYDSPIRIEDVAARLATFPV